MFPILEYLISVSLACKNGAAFPLRIDDDISEATRIPCITGRAQLCPIKLMFQ